MAKRESPYYRDAEHWAWFDRLPKTQKRAADIAYYVPRTVAMAEDIIKYDNGKYLTTYEDIPLDIWLKPRKSGR